MPTITFDPSRSSDPTSLIKFIAAIGNDPTIVSITSTDVVLTVDNIEFVLHGTGFVASVFGFTGDTIEGISVSVDGQPYLEATDFDLPVSTLTTAILNEVFGNPAAVETLFCSLPYTYFGHDNADVFLQGTLSDDGVVLNFRGADTFHLAGGADRIFMGDGNDTGFGDAGNDQIWGGDGKDKLVGGAGNDTLKGDAGADFLNGGAGADVLSGGKGADRFVFYSKADSPNSLSRDRITDFAHGADKIDLRPLGAPGVILAFIGDDGFSGLEAEVRYSQASGLVTADTDADGKGDFSILLANKPVLEATDFFL